MTDKAAQYMGGKRVYLYIVVFVGIVLLLIYCILQILERDRNRDSIIPFACQSFGQPTFDALPGEIQKFHYTFHGSTVTEVAKITWFSCPYPGFYYTLVFYANKTVTHWREVPDWATQGGATGTLTTDGYMRLAELLAGLTGNDIPTFEGKGDYLIGLSFYDADGLLHKLVCAERDCPQEIKDLFDLADGVFQVGDGFMVGTPFSYVNDE